MKFALTVLSFCLSQLIFAQKEDSLMLVIDQVEISSLISTDEIKSYFNDISKLTRGVKRSKTEITKEFGFNSSKRDSMITLEKSINRFLFLKMREYMSMHPYPRQFPGDTVRNGNEGEIVYIGVNTIASSTLIKVFIDAEETPENLDFKKLYFPKFYQAFKDEHIYGGDIWNLLYGMYRQDKNEEYVELELGEDDQIEEMIDALQLKRKPSN